MTTGRSLAEIADGTKQWTASKPTGRKGPAKPKPSKAAAKARKAPAFVPIQLCKVTDHPPGGTGWAHEIKFDGYRIQIGVGGGRAVLRTRKGLDWSDKFSDLAADAATWPDAVIDGELCALDDDHMPDFGALQAAISDEKTEGLVYFAFDLLFDADEDLRDLPLAHRKARLQAYVDRVGAAGPNLRFVEHFASSGEAVLKSACRMDLEGVISKKLDAPYKAGRTSTWVKSKCRGRDEVVGEPGEDRPGVERGTQRLLGAFPDLVRADGLLRVLGGQLQVEIVESIVGQQVEDELQQRGQLVDVVVVAVGDVQGMGSESGARAVVSPKGCGAGRSSACARADVSGVAECCASSE